MGSYLYLCTNFSFLSGRVLAGEKPEPGKVMCGVGNNVIFMTFKPNPCQFNLIKTDKSINN
jgi:hypothetical protein